MEFSILDQCTVIRCGKCDYYLPGVAGGAGAGVSATGLAGAWGLGTITTKNFFSLISYFDSGSAFSRTLPLYINFCFPLGNVSDPFSVSILAFTSETWKQKRSTYR